MADEPIATGEGKDQPTEGKDQLTGDQQSNVVSKDRYDEQVRQNEQLQETLRAVTSREDPTQGQSTGQPIEADQIIREYAQMTGMSLEDAAQWWNAVQPAVNIVGRQYTAVLSNMADQLAVMKARSDPKLGKLYVENEAEILKARETEHKQGRYLSPESALQVVLTNKIIADREKTDTEEVNAAAGARARDASDSSLTSVKGSVRDEGPLTTEDVQNMTSADRKKVVEDFQGTF